MVYGFWRCLCGLVIVVGCLLVGLLALRFIVQEGFCYCFNLLVFCLLWFACWLLGFGI